MKRTMCFTLISIAAAMALHPPALAIEVASNGDFSTEKSLLSIRANGLPGDLLHCGRSLLRETDFRMVDENGRIVSVSLPRLLEKKVQGNVVIVDDAFKADGRSFDFKARLEARGDTLDIHYRIASPGLTLQYMAFRIEAKEYGGRTYLIDGKEGVYPEQITRSALQPRDRIERFVASTDQGWNFTLEPAAKNGFGIQDARQWGMDSFAVQVYADDEGDIRLSLKFPTGGAWATPAGFDSSLNLVKNGSFETGLNDWGVAFAGRDRSSTYGLDSDAARHGDRGLRIDIVDDPSNPLQGEWMNAALSSEFFQAPLQSEVTLSADIKSDREDLNLQLMIRFYPVETVSNRGSVKLGKSFPLKKGWNRYAFSVRLPRAQQGAYSAAFLFGAGRESATVWVDSVNVSIGRETTYRPRRDIELAADTPAFDNLYEPGEPVPLNVSLRNDSPETVELGVRCTVLDPFYHLVAVEEASVSLEPGSTLDGALGDYAVTLQKHGAYRVYVEARSPSGEVMAEHGLTIGILPDRKLERVRPESRFGANIGGNDWFRNLDHASRIGFTWCRLGFPASWNEHEPSPGQYSDRARREMDAVLAALNERGMTPIVATGRPARWATSAPEGSSQWSLYPPSPDHMPAYEDFMRYLVGKLKGRAFAYEVWNEPDIPIFYRGTAREFAPLLQTTHRVVRQMDPDAKVFAFGLTHYGNSARRFLNDVFEITGTDCCDGVSWHPYRPGRDDPESTSMRDEFREIREDIARFGEPKPLWITEVGWFAPQKWSVPHTPYKNIQVARVLLPEELCARWYTQLAVTAFAHGVENIMYFIFEEGHITDRWFHGFVGPDSRSLKSAYFSAAACVRNTDYSDVLGQERLLDDLYLTSFLREGDETQVLWKGSGSVDLEISTSSPLAGEDLYGNPFTLTPRGGKVWLTVTGDAIYLKCPRDAIEIAKAGFALSPQSVRVEPGRPALIGVSGVLPGSVRLESGFLQEPMAEFSGGQVSLEPRDGLIPDEKYQVLGTMGSGDTVHGRLEWAIEAGRFVGSVDHPVTGKRGGAEPGSIHDQK